MWRLHLLLAPKAAIVALEANAARARTALACRYSSSDEYEAEVIQARRAAGFYGPRRQRRQALVAFAAATLAVVLFCLVV